MEDIKTKEKAVSFRAETEEEQFINEMIKEYKNELYPGNEEESLRRIEKFVYAAKVSPEHTANFRKYLGSRQNGNIPEYKWKEG